MKIRSPQHVAKLWEIVERDEYDVVQQAARYFKISLPTFYTALRRSGKKIPVGTQMRLLADHLPKPRTYALHQLEVDAQEHGRSRQVWGDHTILTVPPEPNKLFCWRQDGSKKPIPSSLRSKNKTKILMWVVISAGGCVSASLQRCEASPKEAAPRRGRTGLDSRNVSSQCGGDEADALDGNVSVDEEALLQRNYHGQCGSSRRIVSLDS